jgi:hypothetical protein
VLNIFVLNWQLRMARQKICARGENFQARMLI